MKVIDKLSQSSREKEGGNIFDRFKDLIVGAKSASTGSSKSISIDLPNTTPSPKR